MHRIYPYANKPNRYTCIHVKKMLAGVIFYGQHRLYFATAYQNRKFYPMRLNLLMVAVVALLGAVLAGCDSKKNELIPAPYFSFKVGSETYRSNATTAYITDTVVAGKKTLVIDGVTNNFVKHLELMITFPDSVRNGEFREGVEVSLMDVQQKTDGYIGKSITVKLESINSKHAEGTFSGTLTSGEIEKPLTDGTFKVDIN
ncbi:MAG TPA: hypothetical protein VM802_20570 [Chitinophaga sp.]|uniref:hypothetical protein n=1 Tax=Chitinophaga sp. TaxID=1869181 RepID=UPI002C48BCDA|nr:hypothetical protein [Chitinophaga sp.]HVI47284.1 hypothetical protein [Chitinophaga sp.]